MSSPSVPFAPLPVADVRLDELHRHIRMRLDESGIDQPELSARILLETLAGRNLTDLVIAPQTIISAEVVARCEGALQRCIAGEPLHRVLGQREFYGLPFRLSADTLEPRPDTEVLVELVIPFARTCVAQQGSCTILDLGTGTGAIALSLLSAVPGTVATGVDISSGALEMAALNAEINGVKDRFRTRCSDWLRDIDERFDLVVSNPPYIETSVIETLQGEVRDFDPRRALDGGADGLEFYRLTANGIGRNLTENGRVGVEIGSSQKRDVEDIFRAAGFTLVSSAKDFGGRDRAMLFAR